MIVPSINSLDSNTKGQYSYSSTLYRSLSTTDYLVMAVPESSLNGSWAGIWSPLNEQSSEAPRGPSQEEFQAILASKAIVKLNPRACAMAYATNFQTNFGDVAVIMENSENHTRFAYQYDTPKSFKDHNGCITGPYSWICAQFDGSGYKNPPSANSCNELDEKRCPSLTKFIHDTDWTPSPSRVRVKYCLSTKSKADCRLMLSVQLAWVVVAFNALKLVILSAVWLRIHERPLLTVGDAIASFLRCPDQATELISPHQKPSHHWQNGAYAPAKWNQFSNLGWANAIGSSHWALCVFG
jgi:hypothetical protein